MGQDSAHEREGLIMRKTIRTALRIACLALAVGLLGPAAGQARQDYWPFSDIRITGLGALATRYVYVPKGSVWEEVVLSAFAATDGRTHVAVRLDDRTVYQSDIDHPQFLTIPIGTLEAGFHRIDIRASLTTGEGDGGAAPSSDYCVDEMRIPLILQRMFVAYREVPAEEQFLDALPDTLYNPQKPSKRPWKMVVSLAPDDMAAVSAAARLASGFEAAAPITVVHAAANAEGDADFIVEILHDPDMASPVSIDFIPPAGTASDRASAADPNAPPAQTWADPPSLRIHYSTPEGLEAAVHALLNADYRSQLATNAADIGGVVAPPEWGQIATFNTLADLGLADIEIEGTGSRSLVLAFPSSWEPIGAPEGQIIVRAQDGLLQGSQMQVWVEETLAGSSRLDRLAAGDIQRAIPFQASRVPADALLALRLEAALVTTQDCRPGVRGKVWVDAQQSVVRLPHRLKDGLGSLAPALVARPVIAVGQATPGAVSAILSLAASLGEQTGGRPVPVTVVGSQDEAARGATLRIDVETNFYRELLLQHAEQLYLPELADGVLLLQDNDGYRLVSSRDSGLHGLARHWSDVQEELVSGTVTALLTPTGELIQLDVRPVSDKLVYFGRSDPLPWILAAGAGLILVVTAVLLYLRFGRAARKR